MKPSARTPRAAVWRALLMSAAALALFAAPACTSKSPAPVTYGTAPTAGASTGAYAAAPVPPRRIEQDGYQTAAYRAPVTAVSETYSEGRNAGVARPLYLASTQPVPAAQTVSEDLPGSLTVGPGDTVYAISRRTGASPQAIIALNRLNPPYALSVGQTLRVPSNAVPPSGSAQRAAAAPARSAGEHVVRPGDTLYSLARANGVTVEELARANRLRQPYQLRVGEALIIPGSDGSARVENAVLRREEAAPSADVRQIVKSAAYSKPEPVAVVERIFDWPVKGAVIGSYGALSAGKRNEGVNIAAPVGTPVRAAAAGEVVYRGSELDGYGNLLLIKHADGFVTAYAHNDAMLVKKGQIVRQGEVIAKVGQSGAASEPQLHFEIRQNLRSVDPLALLQ